MIRHEHISMKKEIFFRVMLKRRYHQPRPALMPEEGFTFGCLG